MKHTETVVEVRPNCDFCKERGNEVKADYDGRTVFGSWAYMCQLHFGLFGVGLGLGIGQRLLEKRGNDNRRNCREARDFS